MKRAPHRAVTIRGERQFDGPLMAQRRCDDRHIKQARPAGEKGCEWYLSNEKGGGGGFRSPVGWWSPVPVYIDGCPCRDPHIIVLGYTRRIDQIQSTMDKSGFGTSMLAYDSVRGDWANTSLIKSPRGHTTGSGNAQHYMLACVLLIIAGRNCVRIW